MKGFIERMMGAVKSYTPVDFAIFKIYIFAIGLLVGSYFALFWARNIVALWVIAIVCGAYTVAKLIIYAARR